MKCPICDNDLKIRTEKDEIWGAFAVVEEYHICEHCHRYSYEYVYGQYREIIGYAMFEWAYTWTDKELDDLNKEINLNINFQKEEIKNG